MHRIDSFGSIGGLYTNGVPNVIPATVADADAMNAIQEEIAFVIESAGITLDKNDYEQLLAALVATFGRLANPNTWTGTQTFAAITATNYGAMTGSSVNVGAGTVTAGAVNSSVASTFQPSASGTDAIHAVGVGAGGRAIFAESTNTGAAIRVEASSSGVGLSVASGIGLPAEFARGSGRGAINLVPTAGDPSAPSNGDIWYDSTANAVKIRINGVTRTVNVT